MRRFTLVIWLWVIIRILNIMFFCRVKNVKEKDEERQQQPYTCVATNSALTIMDLSKR